MGKRHGAEPPATATEDSMQDATKMASRWLQAGCVLGLIGVAAGAFGAHALEGRVPPHRAEVWATAARYAMYHAAPLLVIGLLRTKHAVTGLDRAAVAFLVGTGLFSGSLFALVLTDTGVLGAITPLGGLSLMAGWGLLGLAARRIAAPPSS